MNHRRKIWMRFNTMRLNCHNFRLWYAGIGDDGREQLISTYVKKLTHGECELCGYTTTITRELHIDHNHATGIPRGLLCQKCNIGLGSIESLLEFVSMETITTYLQGETNEQHME